MRKEKTKEELEEQYAAYRHAVKQNQELKADGEKIAEELEKAGVTFETDVESMEGLGDLVHSILNKVGITEERFKRILGLKHCNCNSRRKLLNKLVRFR
jgi:hypothetical protein